MRKDFEEALRSFLIEFVVYAVLVVGYFFLVLRLLGPWLSRLFHQQRDWYAVLSLGLIVGQGLFLELLTRLLLGLIKSRTEER